MNFMQQGQKCMPHQENQYFTIGISVKQNNKNIPAA
jgi:hypothetical protein